MQQPEPLVSVIVPVYNTIPYLRETLDSIRAQTYRRLEIILVDDGSTDGSGGICDQYGEADGRFRVFHRENGGTARARNFGLDQMTGEYVVFVDSDDLIKPEYIQRLIQAAGASEPWAEITTCRHMDGGRLTPADFERYCPDPAASRREISLENYIVTDAVYSHYVIWGGLYRSSLTKGLRFSPDLYVGEDTLYFYQLFRRAGRLNFLDECLCYYRSRDDSIFRASYSARQATEVTSWERVIELFGDLPKRIQNEYRAATGVRCRNNLVKAIKDDYREKSLKKQLYLKAWKYSGCVLSSKAYSLRRKAAYLAFLCSPAFVAKRAGRSG